MYHKVKNAKILPSLDRLCLFVLYGSQNKQRLIFYTALIDFFYNRDETCTAWYELNL